MSDGTPIEWTDATWNIITGCSVVSEGCKHCYAMKLAGTRLRNDPSRQGLTIDTKAGPVWNGEVRFNDKWLEQPLRWKRPRRIFVCAHGDLFHERVSDLWLDKIFAVMALSPQHTFQVLTKRPERALEYLTDLDTKQRIRNEQWNHGIGSLPGQVNVTNDIAQPGLWPLPNVWMGVSVENQYAADERIPPLLQTPAAARFLSCEPLLGQVNLNDVDWGDSSVVPREDWCDIDSEESPPAVAVDALTGYRWQRFGEWSDEVPKLDWIIVGGESGPGARPMHPGWALSLRDQCKAAGVAFFFKQWGGWCQEPEMDDHDDVVSHEWRDERGIPTTVYHVGKKAAGRLLDGQEWNEYPTARGI